MRSNRVLRTAIVVGAALAAVAAQPGVAASGRRQLYLTGCAQLGRTDVARNEVVEFRFSVPLRRDSVNHRTLMVNEVVPDGERPSVGALIVAGNVVRFDPRRTQRHYDEAQLPDSLVVEHNHVYGFSAHATYVVRLRSCRYVTTLRSNRGTRLALGVTSSFGTGDRYDDPVPGQPSFIGDHGGGYMAFDPPRHSANGIVDVDASIVLEFSEPILPSSMRLWETVFVAANGKSKPGTLAPDLRNPSGRRWVFVPENGWPSQYASIQVWVTTGVTDLAGNPLKRPFYGRR